MILKVVLALGLLAGSLHATTYYEYFTGDSLTTGFVAEGDSFTLNGKDITILSGAFHYFRVHPANWRDTLKKLRAAGLNTVETYAPWNLHNPRKNEFDFGNGNETMSPFLAVRNFVQMAQEEDLFVLFRPGPFICSEFDFGGMPSWLLTDHTMSLRTSYQGYLDYADAYITAVTQEVADLSFLKGGPILAVQVENEYGHFGYEDFPRDKLYLQHVQETLVDSGFDDVLFFTSDTPSDTLDWGALPGVLMTANFQTGVDENLDTLKALQPNRPLMVMEFWTGWFDHWLSEVHITRDADMINEALDAILAKNSSVNMYMFIGGTNFGFMAGANKVEVWPYYSPIVSSYDYDAPLTEEGDYAPKYELFKATLEKYNPLTGIVDHPDAPEERTKVGYGSFAVQESMNFQTFVDQIPVSGSLTDGPVSMEDFSFLNNGSGQSYGYALYATNVDLPAGNSTLLVRGHVRDMAQVMVNGVVITPKYSSPLNLNNFGFWNGLDQSIEFSTEGGATEIQIMVENLGRVNYGVPYYFGQKKGLWEGPIYVNSNEVKEWTAYPLEFRQEFVNSLTSFEPFTGSYSTPAVYRSLLTLNTAPNDTFLDMSSWGKGIVMVNGFNLGRYWSVGPTKTLYLPAALLNQGDNEFVIFEQYEAASEILSIDHPRLGISI